MGEMAGGEDHAQRRADPDDGGAATLSLQAVEALARDILLANGMAAHTADILADRTATAERDGPSSHGLFMVPSYVSGLRSGWIDGQAAPRVVQQRGGVIVLDGGNGVAQRALEDARDSLCRLARDHGIALLAIRDAHHIGALRADIEPFAEAGFVALSCVTTRPWLALPGGNARVLGTNPIAFAAPRGAREPFVWDMASSAVAVTDVRMAAAAGVELAGGLGLDSAGRATGDPGAVLDGGMLLPFGSHKGAALAMMIEVLAAGLTGGNFALEDRSASVPGAASSNGGQVTILIDPGASAGHGFAARIERWMANFEGSRIPGDGRFARRLRAERRGVEVPAPLLARLTACLSRPAPPA